MTHHTWSTCERCRGLLDVIEHGQSTHPECVPATVDALGAEYLRAVGKGDTAEIARIGAALDAIDVAEHTRSLPDSALYYARAWSWPVFPLRPGGKTPLTEHGFRDATTDPSDIRRWWARVPDANIGVATGHRFDVLDVDWLGEDGTPTGAQRAWPALRDSGQLPDIHGMAITARGGLHVLFRPQTGTTITARKWRDSTGRTRVAPGLDYRGRGGYIVAPPSRSATGTRWGWSVRPSPRITGQPDWPTPPTP
jgi:hypothetical protein